MTLRVESREEFNRLARKLVNENMLKLSTGQEGLMVSLLMRVADIATELALNGEADVEI